MRSAGFIGMICLAVLASGLKARAQSSSLYLEQGAPPVMVDGRPTTPALQAASYCAVPVPEPRRFAVHDLVTIIVRESSSATSEATLETDKDVSVDGSIDQFPMFQLEDLLNGRLRSSEFDNGTKPQVGLSYKGEFEGDGGYERSDQVTTRITAQVIDVKPNGLLALEARTFIKNDEETLTILLNGFCRAEDVAPDNTILSTQMFDLRLTKTHTGELRKASKKGLLTRLLELVFNF
jgi:flagellar L-ring protein precursor FlgH